MSVEVIQSGAPAKFDAVKSVKMEATSKPMSPKHMLMGEGKNDKLLQPGPEGMGAHSRHASVPESLLLKGANTMSENGWSPAHERFLGSKPDLKQAANVAKLQNSGGKKQNSNAAAGCRQQQQHMNGGSRTTDEESGEYDSSLENTSVSSFDFNRERGAGGRSVVGSLHPKPAPSKWDDAEKWLISADAAATRGSKAKVQQLLSTIPSHVIINASKKAALLGQQARSGVGNKLNMDESGTDMLLADHMCTKKIDTAGKFSFMPSPAVPAKARSMSSLDRYPLEELLTCDEGNLKAVNLSDEAVDEDMSKPALRTEKPTSDFSILDGQHSSKAETPRSPASSRDTASYVTPPGLRSVSMRDMGTEMTPIASQEPSRTGTPLRATTPTIRSPVSSRPSTPGRLQASNCEDPTDSAEATNVQSAAQTPPLELSEKQLQSKTRQEILALGTQLGKANIAAWASREEEEEDASKCLKNIDLEEVKRNVLEARASAWEEAEKAKYEARYKREEAKIIAWENHEKAKAEAEMRRIEVKVERMRSHSHEQLMNKLAVAHRRAEDLRGAAEARRVEQAAKAAQRAEYIRQTGNMPPASSSPFSVFLQLGRLCC